MLLIFETIFDEQLISLTVRRALLMHQHLNGCNAALISLTAYLLTRRLIDPTLQTPGRGGTAELSRINSTILDLG